IGADRRRIEQIPTIDAVWVVLEDLLQGGAASKPSTRSGGLQTARAIWRSPFLDPKQDRYVLVTVQSIGNKKRDHHHVVSLRQFPPVGNQWRLFHVNVQHAGIFPERTDLFRFALRRDRAVFIQVGAVGNNQQTRLSRVRGGRDLTCALEQQLG